MLVNRPEGSSGQRTPCWRPVCIGYRPVIRADLVGLQIGWTQLCSSMRPLRARLARLGAKMSGLCQGTSFQPRSSATISIMLGWILILQDLELSQLWTALILVRLENLTFPFGFNKQLLEYYHLENNLEHHQHLVLSFVSKHLETGFQRFEYSRYCITKPGRCGATKKDFINFTLSI